VIKVIVDWADSTLLWNMHVLWLYGFVGCGKSAIALAIALKFERRNRLVGSFFFFRNTGDRSRMTRFATTLAFQLAAAIPEAAPFIKKAVTEEGVLGSSLVAQLRRLVYEPFKAATKQVGSFKTFFKPFLIVIDGLDECEDHQDVRDFIDDMLLFFKKNPFVPLRFFITSRVEQHIEGQLKNGQVRLEDLVNHCSRSDLEAFMHTCFEEEKRRNPVIRAYIQEHGDWPTKEDKDTLVDHIGGSFIFASALFKYIIDPTDNVLTPMERLPHTLNMNPGLDVLYARTLSRSQHLPYFHEVISALALLFEPLPIVGIAELLGIKSFEVVRVLVNLQAIIHIPGTDDSPVTICHTSLRDFLTTESRSGHFFTRPSNHLHLSYCCSILRDRQQPDTAVALYSSAHCAEHLAKFTSLPPAAQGPFPHFPQTLDDFYTHILAKSENQPYFSEIIATIVLHDPLSVSGISERLDIDHSKVVRILSKLELMFNNPEAIDSPVTVCHPSVRQFLTDKRRSGRFISPSYHLKLSYYHFSLGLKHLLSASSPTSQCRRSQSHWVHFQGTISEHGESHLNQLLLDLPSHGRSLSHHLFSFTRLFLWLFEDLGPDLNPPKETSVVFTGCLESLALALELDPAPGKWLHWRFHSIPNSGMKSGLYPDLEHRQKQAMQSKLERVEAAIRAKVCLLLH
jgi:hypothetical protein